MKDVPTPNSSLNDWFQHEASMAPEDRVPDLIDSIVTDVIHGRASAHDLELAALHLLDERPDAGQVLAQLAVARSIREAAGAEDVERVPLTRSKMFARPLAQRRPVELRAIAEELGVPNADALSGDDLISAIERTQAG